MWVAVKSPLLIGNDLREIDAKTLTIFNNPAVIAISQDPLGRSATRVRRDVVGVAKDKYGIGEHHVWSGPLYDDDQVVVFLNAGNEDAEIRATLEEIFVADGPGGSASQIKDSWDVYDLWDVRMEETDAQVILDNPSQVETHFKRLNWYNATEVPYKEGLKARDERLMGKLVGRVEPAGTLKAMVPRHAVKMFRLRGTVKGGWKKSYARDEL
jgi:alpha-galactosidase